MKALVWRGAEDLALEELPAPVPENGEIVFDVGLAGICGSDLHPYRGHAGPRRPPLVLGHEAVGTVAGRHGRFAVFPLVVCGECAACARGEENLCERRGLLGLDRQGVFAEQVRVPADALVPVPDDVDDRLAVLVEPLATCVGAFRGEDLRSGDTVLVVGAGPIGLLAVYLTAERGARVWAVEPLAERRRLAVRFGAEAAYERVDEVPTAGADLALDAVGVESAWSGAVAAARAGGSVIVVGLGQAEGSVPVGDLVRRGITLRGHYAYTRADFEDALTLMAERPPPLDWLEVVALDDAAEGFRRLVYQPEDAVKILLRVS